MYSFKILVLLFTLRYFETSPSSECGIFKEENLNPKSVDHEKLSGRWYEYMDTLNDTTRDNTFVEYVAVCDGSLISEQIAHRWISSLEECRTTVFGLQTATSDSPEGYLMLMSSNDTLGKITIQYVDYHPTEGFAVIHRQSHRLPDGYLVTSRQKDPRNLDEAIKQVITALHLDIGNFNVKPKDFGCERREENGIKL